MNEKNLLIIAAAAIATFFVLREIRRKQFDTSSGQNVVPRSRQDQHLTDQCGGWAECLNGWAR